MKPSHKIHQNIQSRHKTRLLASGVPGHDKLAGSNSHPLAKQPDRHGREAENTHEQSEDAEWECRTSFADPGADEESPGKGQDGAEADDHEDYVALV